MVLALLGSSAALGLWLGIQYLRRVRSKPLLIGLHLILGGASMEGTVMLRGTLADGGGSLAGVVSAVTLGNAVAVLLFTAMLSGLLTPLIAQHSPRKITSVALATHAAVGALGFLLFIAWAL
ncbi:hypothetical protein HCX48_08435 [Rhodocyclus tenuis]|uniref:Uncharacterized protein n=2 Tax=Rhodocyclus gracilis TaxID=2929842 RepID=A0ABX0WHR2_9RHOO|nr:hypothetical protein [Rhodocyclus gracilis]MRD72140.1 hypothetical protein [Rhodocyclus gracilis]NJA89246.1 hypothetical protein [Rhodocyclus gracilis]